MFVRIIMAIALMLALMTSSCRTVTPSAGRQESIIYIVVQDNPPAIQRVVNTCRTWQIRTLEIINHVSDGSAGIRRIIQVGNALTMIKVTIATAKEDDIMLIKETLSSMKEVISVSVQ